MNTRSYAVMEAKKPLVPFEFNRRDLGAHDVALDIAYAGICHSDIHQAREEWGPAIFPMVPGHEIAGTVTSVGSSVTKFKVGDKIGVGVFVDSCRTCENCKQGLQQYCLEGMTGTYNQLERDGKTVAMGGYSNYFVINEDYAVHIPANLPLEGVAPLLCAGITLYSPIKHWNVGPGKKVAVMGLGGLGHMGVKFAVAMGAEVTVLSHSPHKKDDALAMGAHHFVATNDDSVFAAHSKTFDVILNTVSAELDINKYVSLLKLDGTLVVIGLPGKPYAVHVGSLLDGRRSIAGSMIGGIPQLQEMLNFCGEKSIVSDVEVIKADYINEAYERTVASDVKYRFVIDASTI
ncbi:Cinnamyl alcohol dehydrogenase-like protein [Candidatus Planktophila sulfonica]|uniref:alcohol dehydrogenase (NADP(+)) n=1 Tax=Candidatus Planktophila sulfonica TaxID=1884904 RepID=A0A249KGN8_9ACTN|nr:NAD(P)-dependent alcohol dehydrogenase [Candidatus Planktophila sulfonica]ASY15951.1 Cinnamyl alcohol dehydrogenase-like protein [Candidatus Planktophila sulfonica]